jgi:hypothetical protein
LGLERADPYASIAPPYRDAASAPRRGRRATRGPGENR